MTITTIIIDLGGVLVRTEDPAPRTNLAHSLGMTYTELDDLVFGSPSARQAGLGKITTLEHWHNTCRAINWPVGDWQNLQDQFFGGDRMDYELIDLLRSLRPRYHTALLSNNWDFLRHEIERVWKVGDAFETLIISAELGIAKPDPRIYQAALDAFHAAPQEAVFIDDFLVNITAAQQLGWQTIHFQNPAQARQELSRLLEAE